MPSRKKASLSVLTMTIILATTALTLSKLGNSTIAQGQGNLNIGNQTITPQQRGAICNPNNQSLISSIQLNPEYAVFQKRLLIQQQQI
jgi:uncharacterized protein YejL (UPF0352 family)